MSTTSRSSDECRCRNWRRRPHRGIARRNESITVRNLPAHAHDCAVRVAKDLSWDGCIAQAPSREEVLVALDEARRQYAAVMQELKQKVDAPKSPTLPSGWSNGRLGQSVTLAM